MAPYEALLMAAAFLCSLVAGLLFAFAVVVMPGIRNLDDDAFIRSFQTIDRVIQNNHPLFLLVWVGSVLTVIAAAGLGLWALAGVDRLLILIAALIYVLCVQVPTIAINIPLNNMLQRIDPVAMNATTRKRARADFEPRWNRWNAIRTVSASLASLLLLLVLLRM